MSLSEQSQQWYPTSVQVTVLQARGLRIKGKNGTNDAYAIMQVAKEKFSTSVSEKTVAPVWKEEAAFDLPLFHPGNVDRCTLQVSVMHRALIGADKVLGLAIVNLLDLYDNKSRNKTEWFKLMGKTGKPDKDRGEVLLDIQFMKNNMTASMFDLSGIDKSRSRLGKIKDKLKGKKKDGMSDSASAIVPSVGQIVTDSEGEEEADATPGIKKKSKLKSLFAPKVLQRNMSQSMSTLPTLPEKDSAISLSRSSGLNVESSEGKKKFKLFKHKRNGSSDSKVSQGAGSLGQGLTQSNLCVNGSHVYAEETRESRAGSTFSLNSSGHGSMEDLRRGHDRKISTTSVETEPEPEENAVEEMQRRQEEQMKREREAKKRLEEEKRRQIEEEEREQFRREEMRKEEERKRIEREEERKWIEREEERKRIEREEEKRRLEKMEEERKRIEREEERKRIEREEEKRRLEKLEEEKEKIRREEERKRIEREEEEEEEKRRLEKLEEEKRRFGREEERKRIEREEEKRRLEKLEEEKEKIRREEERKRIEREEEEEEEKRRLEKLEEEKRRFGREEERKRIEREEEKRRLEKLEEEKRRFGREEERKRIEREEEKRRLEKLEEERKLIEREEQRRIEEEEEMAKIKREQEKVRREEEEKRIKEERRRKMEEEGRTKLEKQSMKKDEETKRIEAERRHAEEEERLQKEKMEAEENRKRKEEKDRRMTEEKELKEREKVRLEKEKMELEKTEKALKERMRREEERKFKAEQERIRQEKDEMEKQKKEKEQINTIERRPDVKPRSARMNAGMKTEKAETAASQFTNPLEESFLLDEISTSPFEQSKASAKVSAVRPSSSLSGTFFSQATVPNTNPFLDDSDAYSGNTENVFNPGDSTENFEKKRRAPIPPQTKTPLGKPDLPRFSGAKQTLDKTPEDGEEPDVSSLRQEKRPAPLPPDVSKNMGEVLNKDRATLDQLDESLNQSGDNHYDLLVSKEPVAKTVHSAFAESLSSRESGQEDSWSANDSRHTENVSLESAGMSEVSKKKSRAPLPPAKLALAGEQKSAGLGSLNKTLLHAKVSPIDAQPVAELKNAGEPKRTGDSGFKPSRAHAVKPLSTIDNQPDFKDNFASAKIAEGAQVSMKAPDAKGTGPYSQLTHEELVNLLERQKDQLSQKDTKIMELEQYIDNLLVRVIEENPSILMSLTLMKKSV
nr:titin homolog isoform X1 [Misgurnus anguillicaudatus]